MIHPAVPATAEQPRSYRTAVVAATLAVLAAVLLGAAALPAAAATSQASTSNALGGSTSDTGTGTVTRTTTGSGTGSGVGDTAATDHPTASASGNSSGALLFGGFCLALIVATAGGVLWYTVRNRRTI
jgi:hypothetical protein